MLRLTLNITTTHILPMAPGRDGTGRVIAGFASFVMSGDFVIGVIVFISWSL